MRIPTSRVAITARFERLVLRTALAGAAGWLAWAVLAGFAPGARAALGSLILPLIPAAGIVLAWRRERPAALPLATALLGSVVLHLWAARYPAFSLVLCGMAVSLGVPGVRPRLARLNAALALGVSLFAGAYVATALGSSPLVDRLLPPLLTHALEGTAFGFIAGFGHIATQGRWVRDPVEALFRAQAKGGAVPTLAVQAVHLYRRIRETLPAESAVPIWRETRRTVTRLVLQVLGLARQAQDMAEHLALSDRDALDRRRQAMQDAAAGAQDDEARRHYADTAAVLEQRLDRLREFGWRRERVEALCHHCLSVLENMRLASAQVRLTGRAAGADEAAAALDHLNALQTELDCTAEALRELEPDVSAAQPPPGPTVAPAATA